jgi:hypothetical protein
VRDGAADDWDGDASIRAFLADIDAGREEIPEPWSSPACTVSLGEAADVDPAVLATAVGPDGLGGEAFAQDQAADALRPGPVLAALAEQAAGDLDRLSDNELAGLLAASRRLQNRAEYLELAAIAEFTRRRSAQYEVSKARKDPRGCRDGEFAAEELAMDLLITEAAAGDRMDLAADLATRLPETFAGIAAGRIDGGRAETIWYYTRFLSDADAAYADQVLAAAAPELKHAALRQRAARLEMKLDPEGVQRRKEEARARDQRVEARREASGNASLAGRELATEDVMASKAYIDALAVRLRNAGLEGGLRRLRVLVYTDLTQGLDPLDRITGPRGTDAPGGTQHTTRPDRDANALNDSGYRDDDEGWDDEDDEGRPGGGGPKGPGTPAGGLAPLPALVTLIVSAGTLLGWSDAPGEAGTWGLTDPEDTRRVVEAASHHPRTRWCVTVVDDHDGTAVAHGCARGTHPWTPDSENAAPDQHPGGGGRDGPGASGGRDGPGSARDATTLRGPDGQQPGPDPQQMAQLAALLRRLNVTLAPIAKGTCEHRHQEDRYTPSRKLKHLLRARTARCSAPGCRAQAINCDLDHSVPYPFGITCECGLGPLCRRHHRCKQAPGWKLEQPEPGLMRWTLPSGRAYTTRPTVYQP